MHEIKLGETEQFDSAKHPGLGRLDVSVRECGLGMHVSGLPERAR